MEKSKKTMAVPDIGGLLGRISEKREEMPKTPIQAVQPVEQGAEDKKLKSKDNKTLKHKKLKKPKTVEPEATPRKPCGRPSAKKETVEYVKISPRVPKDLKKRVDIALVYERFADKEGNTITTLDEIVAHALEKLLA
jgi:hypothetical protein